MGIWKLSWATLQNEGAQVDAVINWLKRECRATLLETTEERGMYSFHIEGQGIPEGHRIFTIYLTDIIKGVVTVNIEAK